MFIEQHIIISWFDSLTEEEKNAVIEAVENNSADQLPAYLIECYPHDLLQIASLVSSE